MSEPQSLQEMLDAANASPLPHVTATESDVAALEDLSNRPDIVAAEALDSISESLAEVDEIDPDTIHTVVSTLRETNKILREFMDFLKERF